MKTRDLVKAILASVGETMPTFTEDMALQIERQIYQRYGGEDLGPVPKTVEGRPGRRHIAGEVKQRAYDDAVNTALPTPELERRHGISRASLYRLVKRGPAK